ncbi:MAG: hypothetical protein ACLQGP_04815 [Isosphaeraceae bacterium]
MAADEPSFALSAVDLHRIGGGSLENLRIKPQEARMNPPGISLLKSPTPSEAANLMRRAFPEASGLCQAAKIVGSASIEGIRSAGFQGIPNPTKKLPNHHRLIHPSGVSGFTDENLKRLSEAFTDTGGN